ncbi:hypothetical protein Ah1_00002 [Aeromonas phage Ah1]|uniref:Uncharacterized protein n=1 Tax=Aeromonas phage Ah1 TaxID=2053701 RepID=A0A2H4YEE1_9CAUD|nr:hypothetical protein KNT77_gp002 [Aeromonas phage Ah1]AUE22543.1 hypothetical protein Ah1_00002 [Aeromonas phage Ah1]
MTKLPKQYKHWCKKAWLKIGKDRKWDKFYPVSKNGLFRFRVACDGMFEISEHEKTFDRWANSTYDGIMLSELKTEAEFLDWVFKKQAEATFAAFK